MQTEILDIETKLIEHNRQNAEHLFALYNSLYFIYPARMERLNPVYTIVKKNWEKAHGIDAIERHSLYAICRSP